MNLNQNRVVNITSHHSGKDWRDFPRLATIQGRVHTGTIEGVSSAINLVLSEENYAYSLKNTVSKPFENIIETLSSGVTGGFAKLWQAKQAASKGSAASFNPWFKYAKAWTNTEPVSLPLRFDFKLGQYGLWNAKHEVALPIFALLVPVLPKAVNSLTMQGPFHSATELLALVLKETLSSEDSVLQLPQILSSSMLSQIKSSTYKITVGTQFEIDYAYCTDASVTLSTATDQFGYPISGSISLTFEGAVPPALTGNLGVSGGRFYNGSVGSPIPDGGRPTEFAESAR